MAKTQVRRIPLIEAVKAAYGAHVTTPCPIDIKSTKELALPIDLYGLVALWQDLLIILRKLNKELPSNDNGVCFRHEEEANAVQALLENALRTKLGFSHATRVWACADWTFDYDRADGPIVEAAKRLALVMRGDYLMDDVTKRVLAAQYAEGRALLTESVGDNDLVMRIILLEAVALRRRAS